MSRVKLKLLWSFCKELWAISEILDVGICSSVVMVNYLLKLISNMKDSENYYPSKFYFFSFNERLINGMKKGKGGQGRVYKFFPRGKG